MVRRRPDTGWRAAAFAAALFAITLNFLQPLAHAATIRGADPLAAAKMWGAFCLPAAGEDDTQSPMPAAGKVHECCLGLAHAPALAEPSTAFIRIEPAAAAIVFVAELDVPTPVGNRDGPNRPRGPPSFV